MQKINVEVWLRGGNFFLPPILLSNLKKDSNSSFLWVFIAEIAADLREMPGSYFEDFGSMIQSQERR
jgi:hypothetical protein